ncbi:MAG: AAA family ATPase, partial [Actinomycetota bacterium]|nr:AAA family ATPase [Actinomycetota bacterium]
MPAGLRLHLLGGFRAEVAGRTVADHEWQRSGAIGLVKVLALHGPRLHRDQVTDLLWPEAETTLGTSRLNKALHFARRVLGSDRLLLRDDMISLDPAGLWIDVDAFEQAARDGDTAGALALYAGDLLPENRFDGWAESRRTQLREAVVPLLIERGGRADLERVVELDPLREDAYAGLMRLEAAQGHRHLAVRWYDRLAETLRSELGVEPHDDVKRLHASLTPPAAEPRVTEERKLVTVLDADLRGVRGQAADADPERARREIAGWTAQLTEIVTRWGGAAQPVIGGGVIGLFGYPDACEDHAARALWAGHEIHSRFPIPIRLGADTGEIIAPAAGEGALPHQVCGAVLDAAARLRAVAAPGSLLATGRTSRAATPHGTFQFAAGPAHLPGEAPASPVARTMDGGRRLVSASRTVAEDASEPAMVGRDAELSAVLSLVDQAAAGGVPRLVTVTGPAGIGKSRMVREVIARRPGMRVLRGRCLAAGDGITYWALGEILREACGITLADSGEVAHRRLRETLAPALPDRTVHALATTAGIRLPGNPLDDADPLDVDDELGRAWPRLATALAVREPLLLVVEDLHWAGAPLIAMLSRLVTRAEGPVVVLTTARPEYEQPQPADVVFLRALPDADCRALLEALPHRITPEDGKRILARAEGNPYFLGQLAAHLAEGGRGALPDTVHSLLAARVDALPAAEKQVLQRAAVIGRVFWAAPLHAGPGRLEALESRGLIRARPASAVAGQDEYAFQHALLRDVAYAGLPRSQRAARHAEAAAWLEEVARERVGEFIEVIAVHYAAAADVPDTGDWIRGKAFRSLIAAGVSARRRYAVRRALDLHRRAIPYASNRAERAEALEAIGDDHESAYAGDEAITAWREAITALPKDDRRARLCLKTAQMVIARWGGFRTPTDPALGDRVVGEGLAAVTDPSTKAQLLALRALCGGRWAWTGHPDPVPVRERRRAATEASVLAGRIGSASLRGMAMLGVAAVHFQEERYEDAVEAVLQEVTLVEQEGRDRDRALGHLIACLLVGGVRGEYEPALEHALRSYEWARALSPHDRLHGTGVVMICLEQLGRYDEVDPYLDEHLRLRQGPTAEMSCPYIRSGPLAGALALAHR